MSEQPNEELETSVVAKGPGNELQAARIEQGISIDDIARQMNLNAKILKSIEDDDYSDVQSPIFIRGYLRTYARLVGVDEDNTIKVFSEFYQKDDPEIQSIGNTVPEISSNDFRVKWMTYIVIIGLIALLSVWWVNNYKTIESIDATNSQETTEPADSIEENSLSGRLESLISSTGSPDNDKTQAIEKNDGNMGGNLPIEQEPLTSTDSNIKAEVNVEKLADMEAQVLIEEAPITVASAEVSSDTLTQDAAVVDVVESARLATQNEIMPTLETKTFTQEKSASKGNDVLEINVIATSWGEIKDASNFKLLQDLMNAGNTYRFVGQKPFKIFLGNGYGVELALNGHSVDFSKHIKSSNNTARFELEQ